MSWKAPIGCLLLAGLSITAQAGNISLSIDTSLADYVLQVSCSGQSIDQEQLRASRVLQAQIKHHSGLKEKYTMDAYIEGLEAASRCETLEDDMFRFRYAVNEKEQLANAIAFLKSHEAELVDYVIGKTAPYFPADKPFSGEIVLSAAGLSCGGFSMDGAFFIDIPCVAAEIEEEFAALKVLSAHETYHAMQYAFFAPFNEDMDIVDSPAAAQGYFFMSLLTEGTAEFVADSREATGDSRFARMFVETATKGHRRVNTNLRMVGYAAEVLGRTDDSNQRIKDMYSLGFGGDRGQEFYYVGAVMAEKIQAAFGRKALVCIIALTPEQFVLAYDAAASKAGTGTDAGAIGTGALRAAQQLGAGRISWRGCTE